MHPIDYDSDFTKRAEGYLANRNLARGLQERRTRFLIALRELDDAWVSAFHRVGLGDIYFSQLFTELWLRGNDAVTKTDAYELVQGVSMQTAMKYVRQAIADGHLEELENPADARSRLIRMSPGLRELFNGVIDRASEAFGRAFLPRK
jgi:hypothetical protein